MNDHRSRTRVVRLGAICLTLLASPLAAQSAALIGRVTDTAGAPIAEARITVLEAGRSTASDVAGRWRMTGLAEGTYRVAVARVGFEPVTRRVRLGREPLVLEVRMKPTMIELPALQVSASALPTSTMDAPQSTATLGTEALRAALAPSLGETVQGMPGVNSQSLGPALGRPVVRGLTGNRVLVVADGQRQEFQQWGEDHAPNLELADAAAVEIVRGPASVLYGSDAIGGVVNVVPRAVPDAIGRAGFVRGRLLAGYVSNNGATDGSLALEGASGGFGWRAALAGQLGDDLRMPTGRLPNSGYGMYGGSATVGSRGAWGSAQLLYMKKRERPRIAEDPRIDSTFSGYQDIVTDRLHGDVRLPLGEHRLELGAGFQANRRSEFAAEGAPEPTTGLLARTVTLDARLFHAPLGAAEGAIGLSATGLWFGGFGRVPFLPDYRWWNVGVYGFEQVRVGALDLALGLRADRRVLTVKRDDALGVVAQQRDWTALSGNVGLVWHASEAVAVVANVGRGFRAPQAPELFANGVHQGTLAYELGNPELGVETSLNVDLGVRVQTGSLRMDANVFRNAISGYIYYRPTGAREPRSGFEIFQFAQGDALLTGFEASAEWRPRHHLQLTAGGDFVRGTNRSLGIPLPWMPPLRVLYGIRLVDLAPARAVTAFFGVKGETAARQSRVDPAEVAPPGWTRVDVESGFAWDAGPRRLTLDLAVRNAGNAHFARHLNRFKGFAYEMGRHMAVRVGVDF